MTGILASKVVPMPFLLGSSGTVPAAAGTVPEEPNRSMFPWPTLPSCSDFPLLLDQPVDLVLFLGAKYFHLSIRRLFQFTYFNCF